MEKYCRLPSVKFFRAMFFSLFMVLGFAGVTTAHNTAFTIKKGTKLTYDVVTVNGKHYSFVVKVKSFAKTAISFDWSMGGDVKSSGSVTIYNSALEKATTYKNYFGKDVLTKLKSESTVWLSRKNFNELSNASKTSMALDLSFCEYKKQSNVHYNAAFAGKLTSLDAMSVKGSNGNSLVILRDANNPIILKMALQDFTISLQRID
jgi:hypothetical protein